VFGGGPVNTGVRRLPDEATFMVKRIIFSAGLIALLLLACCERRDEKVFAWVERNESGKVKDWIRSGGDPNLKNGNGCSLLYIATGPHGGNDALRALVEGGSSVNVGCGKYTPLMNAASWDNYEGVMLLLKAGADPDARNEKGQRAIDVIGECRCDNERLIREALSGAVRKG
jgi:ankyrin repeat protein